MSQAGTVNIVNSTICVTTVLLFFGAAVGGRESLVSMSQIREPRHLPRSSTAYHITLSEDSDFVANFSSS